MYKISFAQSMFICAHAQEHIFIQRVRTEKKRLADEERKTGNGPRDCWIVLVLLSRCLIRFHLTVHIFMCAAPHIHTEKHSTKRSALYFRQKKEKEKNIWNHKLPVIFQVIPEWHTSIKMGVIKCFSTKATHRAKGWSSRKQHQLCICSKDSKTLSYRRWEIKCV